MNIAILKNDSVPEELQEQFPDYDQMIRDWLSPLKNFSSEKHEDSSPHRFTVYDMTGLERPTLDHDLYVSSGSRKSIYEDEPWIHHYRDVTLSLHEQKKRHFGICFGHQMIALALGAKVGKASGWGIGIHRWEAEGKTLGKNSLTLCVSHQDQVLEMTSEMNRFLKSDFCPNAGFTVGEHIMTVQGHPEFSSSYVAALMELRKSRYPQPVYLQGQESLTQATDEKYLLSVIENFFQSSTPSPKY